jgi:hypothetical protein
MGKKPGHASHTISHTDIGNLWPPPHPPGETEFEKALRIQEEARAAKSSAEIDEAIERSRQESQKQHRQIRILLLGERSYICVPHFELIYNMLIACDQGKPNLGSRRY